VKIIGFTRMPSVGPVGNGTSNKKIEVRLGYIRLGYLYYCWSHCKLILLLTENTIIYIKPFHKLCWKNENKIKT